MNMPNSIIIGATDQTTTAKKPAVWHLIGDKYPGGATYLVQRLISSRLRDQFDFSMLRLEEAKQQLSKNYRPDAIIFHYACAWKYLPDLFRLKKISPIYIYDHHYCPGFEREMVPSRVRFHLMLKLAYGLVDGVLAVSQAQRQWMFDNQLVNPEKVMLLRCASPIEALLQIPPKTPSNPLILGAYGRFARQKGLDVLLKSMAQVSPEHFQLRLGGYGPDEALIHELAQGLPHVTLLGKINDVPSFLENCDVVIIPSRWEPGGTVALEAKAAGKPSIMSAVDGLSEQVQDCGVLVPPDNVTALVEAINALRESSLATWGTTARASVVNAWEEFLQAWENLLERMT